MLGWYSCQYRTITAVPGRLYDGTSGYVAFLTTLGESRHLGLNRYHDSVVATGADDLCETNKEAVEEAAVAGGALDLRHHLLGKGTQFGAFSYNVLGDVHIIR